MCQRAAGPPSCGAQTWVFPDFWQLAHSKGRSCIKQCWWDVLGGEQSAFTRRSYVQSFCLCVFSCHHQVIYQLFLHVCAHVCTDSASLSIVCCWGAVYGGSQHCEEPVQRDGECAHRVGAFEGLVSSSAAL